MARKAIVLDVPDTKEDSDEKEQGERLARAPLFGSLDDPGGIDSIAIERIAPVREGTLPGKLEPETTEDDIAARFGGGKFRLWARDARGKTITNRVIEIGGEPIFSSEIARAQYRRMMGPVPETPAPAQPTLSLQEIIALTTGADERRREDYERRMAEQERAHQREIERLRVDGEQRERERAAEDERRRREGDERDLRREKDAETTRQRDREFHAVMMQIAQVSGQGKADPVQVLLQGFQLGQQMVGGGEPPDAITALASNLPAILERAGSMLPGARAAAAPAAEQVPATQGPQRPDRIAFEGKIGVKARRVVEHLQRQGVDPELAMERAFDMLLATRRQEAPPDPPSPAANGTRGRFQRKPEPPAAPAAPSHGVGGG